MRLQRVMAAAGVAARRVCEVMIEAGRVEVNGEVVRVLPVFVDPWKDRITVDGRAVSLGRSRRGAEEAGAARMLYVMVNKPEKVLSTTRDEAGRATVMDLVHHPALASAENPGGARVYPVGRLDFHTGGLVLLTNDGELANRLTHARYGVAKVYRVEARPELDDEFVRALEAGLNRKHARALREAGLEGRRGEAGKVRAGAIMIRVVEREAGRTTLEVRLAESGPVTVAAMMREAGVRVTKVTRTELGPLKLRGVGLGQWRELERGEVKSLKQAAGLGGVGTVHRTHGQRAR